jgi:hypothetical protein
MDPTHVSAFDLSAKRFLLAGTVLRDDDRNSKKGRSHPDET